jgi:hypothetical protein
MSNDSQNERRDFIKKSAYVVTIVLSFAAIPAIANTGSPTPPDAMIDNCNNGLGQRVDDCQPPGMPRENDRGTSIPGDTQTQANK